MMKQYRDCQTKRTEAEVITDIAGLVVFTLEAGIKIAAEGRSPGRYFYDAWNKLDFFVVVISMLEMYVCSFLPSFLPSSVRLYIDSLD